eukprot:180568_1
MDHLSDFCSQLPSQFHKSKKSYNYCDLTRYCAIGHLARCDSYHCKICADWNVYTYSKSKQKCGENIASRTMLGFQQFMSKNYKECIELLTWTATQWNYALISLIITCCHIHLKDFKTAIDSFADIIYQETTWSFITDCAELNVSDTELLAESLSILCDLYYDWIDSKSIHKFSKTELVSLHKIVTYDSSTLANGCLAWQAVQICYWLNDYENGYAKIQHLLHIKAHHNATYKYDSTGILYAALSSVMLINMGKLKEWTQLIDIYGCNTLISLFIGIKLNNFESNHELFQVFTKYFDLSAENENSWESLLCLNPYVENTCKIFGSLFEDIRLEGKTNRERFKLKNPDIDNVGAFKREDRPHCFIFYYLFAKLMYFKVREHKIAYLLYGRALKYNKNDPVCHIEMAHVLYDCGKFEKALLHLEKAKELNKPIYVRYNASSTKDEIVAFQKLNNNQDLNTNWLNSCNWCGKKTNSIRKCKQCKAAYYCSRKHQKLAWKQNHRKYCKYYSKTKCKRRILAFVRSRWFYIAASNE